MDRDDGARAWRDGALDQIGVNVRRSRINVNEHGLRAAIGDRFGRGYKSVWSCNHFVARLNTERQQPEVERGRPGGERDAVLRTAEGCKFAFEGLYFLAEDECGFLAHAIKRGEDIVAQFCVFC